MAERLFLALKEEVAAQRGVIQEAGTAMADAYKVILIDR